MRKITNDGVHLIVVMLFVLLLGLSIGIVVSTGSFIYGEPKCGGEVELSSDDLSGYRRDMIIVVAEDGVTREEVTEIAVRVGAEVVSAVSDVNFYQFKFSDDLEYYDLEIIATGLRITDGVKHAYIMYANPDVPRDIPTEGFA